MLNWEVESISQSNIEVKAYYTTFKNGLIIFVTDSDEKIGSIAIGTPVPQMVSKFGTSSTPIIFGTKNSLISKAIAEKIASKTRKIALIILNLNGEDSKELMNLTVKVVDNVLQKQN